ncbi:MAG TPA: hypothetical protein VM658_21050 [bacterium]|nr:hypothetical protein [bacterium]
MDFEKLLRGSWDHFVKDIVNLILFFLVGGVLCITIVLIPSVIAGFTRATLAYVRTGRKPEFTELWNFNGYLETLLLMIIGGFLIMIGYCLLIVPGVILQIWWLYALFFIVDRRMGFWQAMSASKDAVSRTGLFNHFVVLLIAMVLNGLGSAVSGLGALVTTPFVMIMLALVYLDLTGERAIGGEEAGMNRKGAENAEN